MTKSVANIIISFAVFVLLASSQAFAFDEFRTNKTGRWDLELDFNYFNATANYTRDGGVFDTLPTGYAYKLMDLDFGARWTPSPTWGFFAQTRYSYASSDDNISTRNNGAISHIRLGADMQMGQIASFDLMPETSVIIPFGRVDPKGDQVLIGEGAMEIEGRLIAKSKWGFFEPMAFIGLTYRDEGRSTLLPYGTGAEIAISSMVLGGELRGYQSIVDDEKTDSPLVKENYRLKNGGALKFFSVNPSLLETNFWLRFNRDGKFQIKIGAGTTVTGSSTAAGWNVFSTLNYVFQGPADEFTSSPARPPELQFKEETNDGVDQTIFQLPPPPNPKPRPKPRAQPTPSSDVQRKKLQKELDQTEMSIELRSNKKKRK